MPSGRGQYRRDRSNSYRSMSGRRKAGRASSPGGVRVPKTPAARKATKKSSQSRARANISKRTTGRPPAATRAAQAKTRANISKKAKPKAKTATARQRKAGAAAAKATKAGVKQYYTSGAGKGKAGPQMRKAVQAKRARSKAYKSLQSQSRRKR